MRGLFVQGKRVRRAGAHPTITASTPAQKPAVPLNPTHLSDRDVTVIELPEVDGE
jgi:hypothetical protein